MRQTIRSQTGSQLVELLVAVSISGFFAVVLSTSLAQTKAIGNRSENSALALYLAQEVMERVRSTPFDQLPANGTHNVRVNQGDPDAVGDPPIEPNQPILGRPLMIDATSLVWNPSGGEVVPGYKFRGTVQLELQDGPLSASNGVAITKNVTVTVTWSDNTSTAPHVFQLQRLICKYGIQRNVQS